MSINFLRIQLSGLLNICLVTGLLSTSAGAQQASITDLLKVAVKGNGQQQYHAIDDLGERGEDAKRVVPQLVKPAIPRWFGEVHVPWVTTVN